MTVCVATMAAQSKAIILVADKAVTYEAEDPSIPAIWAETDIRKIYSVGRWREYLLRAILPSVRELSAR